MMISSKAFLLFTALSVCSEAVLGQESPPKGAEHKTEGGLRATAKHGESHFAALEDGEFWQRMLQDGLSLGPPPDGNIVEVLQADGEFDVLVDLTIQAGLADDLANGDMLTVFAPTDPAFGRIPIDTLARLTDPDWFLHLEDLLLYHVLGEELRSSDLSDGLTKTTLNGEDVVIFLGPPPNPPRVNTAPIVEADIDASNGVIHRLDDVLAPTSLRSNIMDIARDDPDNFSELVSLLEMEELDVVLEGDGPFTVFAPTNAAFDDFGGVPDGLTLSQVLTYHVVSSIEYAEDLSDGQQVTTVQGSAVVIGVDGSSVTVNDANVLDADVLANNGVIHVIDEVLVPPAVR